MKNEGTSSVGAAEIGGTNAINPKLAAALKSWCLEKSHELSIPAYIIFDNKTLDAIARIQPRTPAELLDVPGISHVKAEGYGSAILRIVKENCWRRHQKLRLRPNPLAVVPRFRL